MRTNFQTWELRNLSLSTVGLSYCEANICNIVRCHRGEPVSWCWWWSVIRPCQVKQISSLELSEPASPLPSHTLSDTDCYCPSPLLTLCFVLFCFGLNSQLNMITKKRLDKLLLTRPELSWGGATLDNVGESWKFGKSLWDFGALRDSCWYFKCELLNIISWSHNQSGPFPLLHQHCRASSTFTSNIKVPPLSPCRTARCLDCDWLVRGWPKL